MIQLNYDMWSAAVQHGIKLHPQEQMRKLGFKVIHCVPQSMADCWWFTVKEFDFELPAYLSEMKYNLNYWMYGCYRKCEYFKKAFDEKTQTYYPEYSCFGGTNCLKEVKE